jgi:integrase
MPKRYTNVYERNDGYWVAPLDVGEGKTRKRKVFYGRTKDEANAKRENYKAERLLNGKTKDTKDTVSSYLNSFIELQSKSWSSRTQEIATFVASNYVLPYIGGKRVDKLEATDIESMMEAVADKVSTNAANKARNLVHQMLERARKRRHVLYNVAGNVDTMKEHKRDYVIWSQPEIDYFLESIKEHRWYAAYYTLFYTGLRIGELLGLKWQDIEDDTLVIRQNLLRSAPDSPKFGKLKTRNARRIIEISDEHVDILNQFRKYEQANERNNPHNLVFCSRVGTPMTYRNFLRDWEWKLESVRKDYIERVKALDDTLVASESTKINQSLLFPTMRLHDIRHTHVSLLIAEGKNILEISNRIGHGNPAFTLSVYSHLLERKRKTGLDVLERIIK